MTPFTSSDEATETTPASARLEAFTEALFAALVPPEGECRSLQGELVRALERLSAEHFQNGMGNYYVADEPTEESVYGRLLLLMLKTLCDNRSGALSVADITFFSQMLGRVEPDRILNLRVQELEAQAEEKGLSAEEQAELESLDSETADAGKIPWEALCNRAERCIANFCIANPELVGLNDGEPVEERGVRSLESVWSRPDER